MKIFISHSSHDREIANKIAGVLSENCLNVWLDEWEINVGESITQRVQDGLEQSRYICVILSKNSLNSGWVEKEWQSKIGAEAQTKKVHIIPILLEDCKIPLLLQDKKYADFRKNFHDGISALLKAFHIKKEHEPIINSEIPKIPKKDYLALKYKLAILIALICFGIISLFIWKDSIFGRNNHEYILNKENKNKILTQASFIVPPPESYRIKSVLELPDLDYSAFEIIEQRRVVDFREWKPFKKEESNRVSPVNWNRKLIIKKVRETDIIRLEFATEGAGVDVICTSGQDYYLEAAVAASMPRQLLLKTVQAVVNVKKYNVGETFILEFQATLWNGSPSDEDWTATKIYQPIKIYSFMLLFPQNKLFKTSKLVMYKPESTEELIPPNNQYNLIISPDNQVLFWELKEPTPNYTYEIQWKW